MTFRLGKKSFVEIGVFFLLIFIYGVILKITGVNISNCVSALIGILFSLIALFVGSKSISGIGVYLCGV